MENAKKYIPLTFLTLLLSCTPSLILSLYGLNISYITVYKTDTGNISSSRAKEIKTKVFYNQSTHTSPTKGREKRNENKFLVL